MKVLLLRPDNKSVYGLFKESQVDMIMPPLGLFYLDAFLASHNYDCSVWDARTNDASLEDVLETTKPDIVGMGCTTPEIKLVLEAFRKIKQHSKDIITIAGGVHFSAVPNEQYDCIDHIVVGEGEQGLLLLLNNLKNGKVHDSVIQSEWIKKLDSIPVPRWENITDWGYMSFMGDLRLEKIAMVTTSRGCPFRCSFCYNSKNPRPVRFRSIQNVEEEIKKLSALGIRSIIFADDSFSLIKHRTLEMCDILKQYQLKWSCLMRADKVEPNLMTRMVDSGCVLVSIGVESGNDKILKSVNKGESIAQIRKAFDILKGFDIEKRASFILGHPYDTKETVEETITLALSLPVDRAFFNIMTPYPSSEVYDRAMRGEGIHIVNKDWQNFRRYGQSVIETDELSTQDLISLQKEAHRRFYTQPKILLSHLNKLVHNADQEFYLRPVIEALQWSAE